MDAVGTRMTEVVRWGLLSTARINDALIAGIRAAEGAELVAVASRREDSARVYAAEQGIPRAHGSYEALLGDGEVDVVYVSLPNALHVPWSVASLEAGRHVLCEKPMAPREADVREAFDVAERAGRLLMEAFMWRYHPQTDAVVGLVRDGVVGELRQVHATFSFPLPDTGDVRWDPALEGGALMDVGCYCVSALRLLAGEPERVSGRQFTRHGVDVRFAGTLGFAGGVLGSFDCGFDMVARSGLEVIGDMGSLYLPDPWHSRSARIEVRRPGGTEAIDVPPADPYACELEDFAAAVRGERPHPFGREDAVGQARTIAALYRSAEFGADAAP